MSWASTQGRLMGQPRAKGTTVAPMHFCKHKQHMPACTVSMPTAWTSACTVSIPNWACCSQHMQCVARRLAGRTEAGLTGLMSMWPDAESWLPGMQLCHSSAVHQHMPYDQQPALPPAAAHGQSADAVVCPHIHTRPAQELGPIPYVLTFAPNPCALHHYSSKRALAVSAAQSPSWSHV